MKKMFLSLIFSVASFVALNAQGTVPSLEEKKILNNVIDAGFSAWGRSWRFDKYVGRSVKVSTVEVDDDYGDLIVYGTFTFSRLFQNTTIPFTANISKDGESLKLKKLAYDDTSSGMKDSITLD